MLENQRKGEKKRQWVVLIDGLPHQIRLIKKVMKRLTIKATIVMDFIHVLEEKTLINALTTC